MSDSDVEIKKIPPMKPVKQPPKSPTEDILKAERKITTKAMIHDALIQLKTRKGVSIQAIKKFMEDKYNIETEKVKYLIKKTLKSGVEDGSIIQLKGIGASGSFKLAAVKEKPKKKPKMKKEKSKKDPTKEKKDPTKEKKDPTKQKKEKPAKEKKEKVTKEKETKKKMSKPEKKVKIDPKGKEKVKKMEKPDKPKAKGKEEVKEKKSKMAAKAKMAATPTKKKAAMMKRKSIGSIIKPPKMKPKSKS